jgi:translation initiation factor IF-2
MDIRANPSGRVTGTVIEAELDKAKGSMATLLVQNGTLEVGDTVVAGMACGRLKAMFDYRGRRLRKAGPSTPVSVMGLNEVPQAGDVFEVAPSERQGRTLVMGRQQASAEPGASQKAHVTLEQLYEQFKTGEMRELRLILKADVQGSLEPIVSSLKDLSTGDIAVNILHAEAGNITENDVMLASASRAIVIGFSVQADAAARRMAEAEGVSIRLYDIIYRLIEDVEKALKGMLEPELKEVVVGRAEVRAVFRISKIGNVAGCYVTEGEIRRNARSRLRRGGTVVHEANIASLKHLQEDVSEIRQGFECGIALKNCSEYAVGDVIECYVVEKVQPA